MLCCHWWTLNLESPVRLKFLNLNLLTRLKETKPIVPVLMHIPTLNMSACLIPSCYKDEVIF